MQQSIIDFLNQYNLSSQLIIFIISILPVLELRGGLIAASILRVPMLQAFLICFVANIIPIPFILLFIKQIFKILKKINLFKPIIDKLEKSAMRRSESVVKKEQLGLFLFVAIPLPMTGGWTGALISALLDMPIKKSFPAIAAGVFCAGIIMIMLTYLVPGLFGF